MATPASEAAHDIEVLRHQARTIDLVVRRNVEGLTHEDSLIQPRPAGNCLNWVVGHLVATYNGSLPVFGQEPVMEKDVIARYERGSRPLRDSSKALPLGDLLSAWDEAVAYVEVGLADLTVEALDRPAPFSPGDDPDETVRSLLTTILFHQAYHAGQLGILRRIAGEEGAIG